MTLYFDVDTRSFVTSPGYRDVVSALTFKRGDNLALAVKFCLGTTIIELASGATGKIGFKPVGNFDGDLVGGALSWTKTGTGTATVYTFDLNLNTAELNTLLGVGAAADVPSVLLNMEMEYIAAAQVTSSNTILATIQNDVIRDEDETPTALPNASDWLSDRAIRYDTPQSLSAPQKAQAITNIGAATPASVEAQIEDALIFPILDLRPSFWLDAQQLNLADGAAITSLVDASGNHRTITNSGTAPTFEASGINSKPWILSPARTLISSSFQQFPAKRGTWFVVYRPDTLQDQKRVVGSFQGGTSPTWVIYNNDDFANRFFYSGAFATSYTRLQGDAAEEIVVRTVRRSSDTAYEWFRNSTFQWSFTLSDHATAPNPLRIGQELNGRIGEVIGFDEALSDSDIAKIQSYLVKKWTNAETVNLAFEGDSQTAGAGITSNYDTYPSQLKSLYGDNVAYVNRAVSGSKWIELTNRASTIDLSLSASGENILVVWCGTNESSTGDSAASIAAATAYLQARKLAGWKKIIVLTAMDRVSSGDEVWRAAYNTGLRNLCAAEGYLLADIAADPNLGPAGAYANTTYFNVDGIHINPTGAGVVAGLVKAQIDLLLA